MKCLEYWSLVSIGYLVNVSAGLSGVDTVHGEVECPGQKERGAAVLCPKDVRVHQRLHRIDNSHFRNTLL